MTAIITKKKTLTIKVTPNSRKDEVITEIDMFGTIIYKVKTTKPPEDNKANNSVIELLAKHFKIAKSKVRIIKGETFRTKIIEIEE